jgi:hypothetical protein
MFWLVLALSLFPVLATGAWILIARRREAGVLPEAPPEAEESCFIPQEWELVRRSHCLPTRCPRVVGRPAGPRKDACCQVCAAALLDGYWNQLLLGPESSAGRPRSRPRAGAAADPLATAPLILLQCQHPRQERLPTREEIRPRPFRRARRQVSRWRLALVGACGLLGGAGLLLITPWAGALAGAGGACLLASVLARR